MWRLGEGGTCGGWLKTGAAFSNPPLVFSIKKKRPSSVTGISFFGEFRLFDFTISLSIAFSENGSPYLLRFNRQPFLTESAQLIY